MRPVPDCAKEPHGDAHLSGDFHCFDEMDLLLAGENLFQAAAYQAHRVARLGSGYPPDAKLSYRLPSFRPSGGSCRGSSQRAASGAAKPILHANARRGGLIKG